MAAQAQALVRSASNASKQLLSNPQVKQAVELATTYGQKAQGLVTSQSEEFMNKNRQYVLGQGPGFFVTKQNIYKVAFFTALAEYVPGSMSM
jgi:hypothetical protein